MRDEERSQVFDAHEDLGKAWRRFKADPASELARAQLGEAIERIQRLDVHLLQNHVRAMRQGAATVPPARQPADWWRDD